MEKFRDLFETRGLQGVGSVVFFKIGSHEWAGEVKEIKGKNIIVSITPDLVDDWEKVQKSDPNYVVIYKNDII